MKKTVLVLIALFLNTMAFAGECISREEAVKVVKDMTIKVESFDRAELERKVVYVNGFYRSIVEGENPPICEFEGQCFSDFHHTYDTGILDVVVTCSGQGSYEFINDVEHD